MSKNPSGKSSPVRKNIDLPIFPSFFWRNVYKVQSVLYEKNPSFSLLFSFEQQPSVQETQVY